MSEDPPEIDWPMLVHKLGERYNASCIEPSVLAHLRAAADRRVLVTCSGGADSVFMLCLLYVCRHELGLELFVAHYNHRWRGDASDLDCDFVRAIAAALDLPFYTEARPEQEAAFTETTARALRLVFFRKAAEEAECKHIALGHQLDDILETQLQRLARGVGSDGLAAPRPISTFRGQPTHLRPLLNLRAGDIRMAMHVVGIPWREDSTNSDTRIVRNLLRHEVIPDLVEALDRDPAVGAARSRQLLEEDAAALDRLAHERLPQAFAGEERLPRAVLDTLPRALTRRALNAWLLSHHLIDSVSASALEMLIEGLMGTRSGGRQSAGAHFICYDERDIWIETVELESMLSRIEFEPGQMVVLSNGQVLESALLRLTEPLRQRVLCGGIQPDCEAWLTLPSEGPLVVRGWLPGDRFRPLGAPGSKKLKDWFIDRGIPKKERKCLPVVTTALDEVIWVPGFPPAEELKISTQTKQALRLTYCRRNPPSTL